jgi:crossover junction endodeoxyribonuclease RuvC
MKILGIDPGTASLGYGLIEKQNNNLKMVTFGCFKTDKDLAPADRLKILYQKIVLLIKKFQPQRFAIEQIFFFKNAKTIISVSQARGIAMLAAANLNLEICEYTPLQVKQAVVGYGLAQKQQIQKMVKAILGLKEIPRPDDAADALAVAICAANSLNIKQLLTDKK